MKNFPEYNDEISSLLSEYIYVCPQYDIFLTRKINLFTRYHYH